MKLLLILTVATTFIGSHAHAAAATTNLPPATTKTSSLIAAKGKGFEITRHEMDQVLANALLKNPDDVLPPEAELHVLDQLIEIELVMQKASDAEKAEGKRIIDEKFPDILKTLGPTEFERRLKATHMTPEDLRRMLFREETAQTSLTRQLGIKVTDAEAKKFFDENPGVYDQPEKARIRELLLLTTSDFSTSAAPPLPEATIQAKRKLIYELHQRIRAGENFTALAKQYNEDPISKDNASELTFKREEMEFGDLAFSMKTNQISEVITNDEGFRIIELLEIIPAKKAEFASVSDRIKNMLVGEQKRMLAPAYLKQLRKEQEVEVVDPGLKAKIAAFEAEAAENAKARAKAQAQMEAELAAEATNMPAAKP